MQILFVNQKWTASGTINKDINIAFNQNIWRDDGLGEINIFLYGHIPGIANESGHEWNMS